MHVLGAIAWLSLDSTLEDLAVQHTRQHDLPNTSFARESDGPSCAWSTPTRGLDGHCYTSSAAILKFPLG